MKIAFFGTPDFAVATLDKLVQNNYNVTVYTSPDKPSGRGLQLTSSDVKKYALQHQLPLHQPERLKNPEFIQDFQAQNFDLAVVVAFRMMPEVLWSSPKLGTINLHGSLLPDYRGSAPINWAIINGETQTGVTTFFINSQIDHGDILLQKTCPITPQDTFGTMYEQLKTLGADLVIQTLQGLEQNTLTAQPQHFTAQDHLAPKITKETLQINDFSSCQAIDCKVRGLIPAYKPTVVINHKNYIIKNGYPQTSTVASQTPNFDTDNATYLRLICPDGYYYITEIQAEGKKPLDIKSFFNGNKI